MTAFITHLAFEFKTGLRNPTAMLMNYLFPLGFYAMMGWIMTQINPGFKDVLVPPMVVFAIMASNLLGLPNPLVDSREAGIYRSFKINGVPALSILSIPAMSTIFHALIVSAIITLTAPIFDGKLPQNWLAFALITLLTAATFGTIGMLIGVIATSSPKTLPPFAPRAAPPRCSTAHPRPGSWAPSVAASDRLPVIGNIFKTEYQSFITDY